jgi:hypothetical protein
MVHLPIVYGWGYWAGLSARVGPTLSAGQSLLAAIAMVIFSVSAALVAQRWLGRGRWRNAIVRATLRLRRR